MNIDQVKGIWGTLEQDLLTPAICISMVEARGLRMPTVYPAKRRSLTGANNHVGCCQGDTPSGTNKRVPFLSHGNWGSRWYSTSGSPRY